MFRRGGRPQEEPEESLEPTDEETDAAQDTAASGTAEPRGGTGGPWDVEDTAPEMERIDFGAIQVPIGPGIEVQVNVEGVEEDADGNVTGGRIVAITAIHGESGLQVQPFAAPKKSGIWEEIRRETAEEITEAGGQTEDAEGPFGAELRALVPVAIPPEMMDQVPPEVAEQGMALQPVRFIGVDGHRWFLRGVLSGAALENEEEAEVLEDTFRGIVVVRGDAPRPPRELLDLTLPQEAQEALAQQAEDEEDDGREVLNPFERGPEITEVR